MLLGNEREIPYRSNIFYAESQKVLSEKGKAFIELIRYEERYKKREMM